MKFKANMLGKNQEKNQNKQQIKNQNEEEWEEFKKIEASIKKLLNRS